jgi:hypothetical protein
MERNEPEAPEEEFQYIHMSFGVRGDSLVPAELTAALDVQPSHAFAKGDEYTSVCGTRRQPSGVWQLRSKGSVSSADINDHARFILKHLEPKREVIKRYLANDQFYVDIRIWCESDSPVVSFGVASSLFARLATLCNDFNFSFIATPEEDGENQDG